MRKRIGYKAIKSTVRSICDDINHVMDLYHKQFGRCGAETKDVVAWAWSLAKKVDVVESEDMAYEFLGRVLNQKELDVYIKRSENIICSNYSRRRDRIRALRNLDLKVAGSI